MIHNKKTQTNQRSPIFNNYNLSTKKFDGNLLYNLFLANRRVTSPGILQNQKERDRKKRAVKVITQEKKQMRSQQHYTTIKPSSKVVSVNSNELLGDSQESEKNENLGPRKPFFAKRNCISGNNFYSNMYESMKLKLKKFQTQKQVTGKKTPVRKLRQSVLKTNQKNLKAQDFIELQFFNQDLLQQGRISGFSAQSITVMHHKKKIYEVEGDVPKEIASLTKIMTCIVCLFLSTKFEIDIYTKQVKISRKASLIQGTTASLKIGDILTINDLLHGMMLPSGNDAAFALAQFFGKVLQDKKKLFKSTNKKKRFLESQEGLNQFTQAQFQCFIQEMNNFASHLKMKNTTFNNPHGLSDKKNKSTSNDIAQLCYYAMKNEKFRNIVKTKEYQLKIYSSQQKIKRDEKWINTNKLLSLQHCYGIKTGITPAAGPCMTAYFSEQNFSALIVILNSKSKSSRFYEVKNLFEWAKNSITK